MVFLIGELDAIAAGGFFLIKIKTKFQTRAQLSIQEFL